MFLRQSNRALRLGVLLVILAAALLLYWYVEFRLVPVYVTRLPSGRIFLMEDERQPALQRFREQEGIDAVVAAAADELSGLQALAKWTSQLFPATTPFPDYPPWNAAEVLRLIRAGKTGGFCAQYAIVFAQSCQSLGYQVRYCDLATDDATNSHFVPEVYLPSHRKWVVFEPQFGISYSDGQGSPLGILDLNEIQTGVRPGPVYEAPAGVPAPPERLGLYHNYRFYLRNNFLAVPTLYTVRVVSGGLQWIFGQYRPLCPAREAQDEPDGRAEFDYSPDLENAERALAFSMADFLEVACGEDFHATTRIKAPVGVLEDVVETMLVRNYEFHPLDGDTSWWPVSRSWLRLKKPGGAESPARPGP